MDTLLLKLDELVPEPFSNWAFIYINIYLKFYAGLKFLFTEIAYLKNFSGQIIINYILLDLEMHKKIYIPFFHKPTDSNVEKTNEISDDVATHRNRKIVSSNVSNQEESGVHETLNNIMAVKKNPSTVFKPPFGTSAEEHHSRLGEHARHLWRDNKMTDLVVKIERKQYPCHKTVLSCYSKYFKDLILKQKETVNVINLRIPSVTSTAFEVLLWYMYTSELNLTCQNIGDVYTAARKLGIDEALILCTRILHGQNKHEVFSVYVYVTAKKLGLQDCAAEALKIMTRKFEHIVGTPEFLDMDISQVKEFLSQDVLATRSEVVVFLAALKWLSVKYLEREECAVDLICCVRFQMMTLNEILACFSPPLLPGILELEKIQDHMMKATCYVAAATVNEEKRFKRFSCKPRKYLLEREPLILWDPSISDPDRHAIYRSDMAAIKIQAAYRGYRTRKSIDGDIAAGILKPPEIGYSLESGLTELDEFEIPKDTDDDTFIGEARAGDSFLSRIKKCIVSFISASEGDEKVREDAEEISDEKEEKKLEYDEDSTLISANRSSSVDTLIDRLNNLAETTEIKQYPTDSAANSEMFQMSHKNSESLFKNSEYVQDHFQWTKESSDIPEKGFIFSTGGFKSDKTKGDSDGKKMFVYNVSKNYWKSYSMMEEGRHHHCCVFLDNKIYLIGGCNPKKTKSLERMTPDKKCYKLDLKSKKWSRISNMKHSRMYHGVAEINGKIYVVGGKDRKDRLLSSIEIYNPQSNVWEELDESLEMPTMGCGVCAHQGKIWVIGGLVQDKNGTISLLDDVKYYDPDSKIWNNSTRKLPYPRGFSTAISFDHEICLIGGVSKNKEDQIEDLSSISDILCFKKEKQWVLEANLPFPRHFVNANVIGSNLYILGGFTSYQAETVDQMILYNKKTGKCEPCASLPEPLCGIASVSIAKASPE